MKHPDPKLHLRISLVKSALRILAGTGLVLGAFTFCGAFLIIAEVVGIIEELV
jgi:hypothetical protein